MKISVRATLSMAGNNQKSEGARSGMWIEMWIVFTFSRFKKCLVYSVVCGRTLSWRKIHIFIMSFFFFFFFWWCVPTTSVTCGNNFHYMLVVHSMIVKKCYQHNFFSQLHLPHFLMWNVFKITTRSPGWENWNIMKNATQADRSQTGRQVKDGTLCRMMETSAAWCRHHVLHSHTLELLLWWMGTQLK